MKLADWLCDNRVTPEQLRVMLDVDSRTTVTRYLTGERTPRPDLLRLIEAITDGQVTKADFKDPSPPRCAAVVLDDRGEPVLVFPWSRGRSRQDQAFDSLREEPREGDRLTNPVTLAIEVLRPRAKPAKRGGFLLDGRLTDARRIVQAANAVLIARGEEPIPYPGTQRGAPRGPESSEKEGGE